MKPQFRKRFRVCGQQACVARAASVSRWALPTTRAKHNKGMKNKAKWQRRWCMAQGQLMN